MAYPRRLLGDNEQIVLEFHPHWWQIFWALTLSFLSIVALIVIGFFLPDTWEDIVTWVLAAVVVVVWVWFAGSRLLSWRFTDFVLTSDRVIFRAGVFAKHAQELPIESVQSVTFNQNVFERIVRSGDLLIESASEDGLQSFANIPDPERVQVQIHRTREQNTRREMTSAFSGAASEMAQTFQQVQPPSGPPPGPPPTQDIPAQIERLAQLRQQGVLSEEEFHAKKAELLRRM